MIEEERISEFVKGLSQCKRRDPESIQRAYDYGKENGFASSSNVTDESGRM